MIKENDLITIRYTGASDTGIGWLDNLEDSPVVSKGSAGFEFDMPPDYNVKMWDIWLEVLFEPTELSIRDSEQNFLQAYMLKMKQLAELYDGVVDEPYNESEDVFDKAFEEAMELKKKLS